MTTQPFDDSEYPYSSKPAVVLSPERHLQVSAPAFSWRVLWGVVLRLGLVAGVLFVLMAVPIVVVIYRARSQAAIIADLEDRGCDIGYENAYVGEPETLQEFLQKNFGNEYFGDVDSISAVRLTRPEHAAAVCRLGAKFSGLKRFGIHSEAFQFEQIARWPQLNRLTSLTIHSNQLTDDDLARIAQMEQLEELSLSSNRISEAGIHSLSALPALWSLELHSVPLAGKAPRNAAGFPKLTRLAFQNCSELRDQMILNLGPLPELRLLVFDDTAVGDQALDHVTRGGKLESVNLVGTKITDSGMASFARCPKLTMLDVSSTAVTDEGIQKLAICEGLSYLDVTSTKITGKGWKVLRADNLTLVANRTELDDEGLKEVLSMSGVREIIVTNAKVTGTGAGLLSELALPFSLNLSGNPLTEAGAQVLARAKLSRLDLMKTPLDDKALMAFVGSDNISELGVSETKVTSAGVVAFYEARKRRLESAGQMETLTLICDFPDAVEPYLPKNELIPDGVLEGSSPSFEPEQPPLGEQPSAGEQPPPADSPAAAPSPIPEAESG